MPTDTGVPSYVGVAGPVNGYVKRGYQKYYSSETGVAPGTPPVQYPPFPPPPYPINWPHVPPTLPPITCPPLNSVWAPSPVEPTIDQIGYTPPVSNPNDDGLNFPITLGDVVLKQDWHGLPSTLNPDNIALYNLQIQQVIHNAIAQANATTTRTFTSPFGGASKGGFTVTIPISPIYDIQVAVEMAVLKSILQGTALWYELVLKPLPGTFSNYYVIDTTSMAIPMGINLSA